MTRFRRRLFNNRGWPVIVQSHDHAGLQIADFILHWIDEQVTKRKAAM